MACLLEALQDKRVRLQPECKKRLQDRIDMWGYAAKARLLLGAFKAQFNQYQESITTVMAKVFTVCAAVKVQISVKVEEGIELLDSSSC